MEYLVWRLDTVILYEILGVFIRVRIYYSFGFLPLLDPCPLLQFLLVWLCILGLVHSIHH